ncbi:MAG: hypothetical protein HDR06_15530 [Lachnospiraceae bacterium]|nr:hypothetical protein [Lachnospiraceae bacterium]
MTNLILFVNAFLSYLLIFVLIVALVIVACIIGVKCWKSKDVKEAVSADSEQAGTVGGNTTV